MYGSIASDSCAPWNVACGNPTSIARILFASAEDVNNVEFALSIATIFSLIASWSKSVAIISLFYHRVFYLCRVCRHISGLFLSSLFSVLPASLDYGYIHRNASLHDGLQHFVCFEERSLL